MTTLEDLLAALELDLRDDGSLQGSSIDEGHGVVFGGQLLAQSLLAGATPTEVAGKEPLSIHLVFARAARPDAPLDIDVDVVHAGRGFATTSVTIGQGGRPCTRATVMLHAPDADLIRHADPAPPVDGPDRWRAVGPAPWWDLRYVDDVDLSDPDLVGPAELAVWSRFPGAPADGPTSRALLAYASDGFLIGTAMRPHPGVGQALAHVSIATTVLSHTLTFHEPFDASDWLLLAHHSTCAGRGRSAGRADVFTEDGRLVASYSQESMIRAPAEGSRS